MRDKYDGGLVTLSLAMAFVGSYFAISLCEQLRLSFMYSKERYLVVRWFLLTGLAFGGIAIWSMHFIGMASMKLYDESGKNHEIFYDIGISIASLIAVVLLTICGVIVSSYDPLFMKSKAEIVEIFLEDAHRKLTMKEIKQLSSRTIIYLIGTKQLLQLFLGGTIAGTGIVTMHYVGMDAMRFQGKKH